MKNNNGGCLAWLVVLIAIAFSLWKIYEILSADIPTWLKLFMIGRG